MADNLHPAASHHMPWFISGPHEGDPLYVITTLFVIAAVVGLGVLFFTLHSLPERLGHKKMQFEVVAVLGLLSLFTHIHAFWVAGLLLAMIDLPDFVTPWKRMATSLEKLSGIEPPAVTSSETEKPHGDVRPLPRPATIQPFGT
ncbi:MAG: hypothetical protein K2Q28_04760 [Hyphomicrobium sp.]|nr:hypothetical protein [Hyphomicrobium sp.]